MLVLTSSAVSQHIPGSIELKECRGCEDYVERPTVSYPTYVGYGPHKFEGDVGVQILIGNDGKVISAKAIFGHPYFRSIVETGALRAKFNAANPQTKRDAKQWE